jgi:hypothetical protein
LTGLAKSKLKDTHSSVPVLVMPLILCAGLAKGKLEDTHSSSVLVVPLLNKMILCAGLAKGKLEDTHSSVLVVPLLALMNAVANSFPDSFRQVFMVRYDQHQYHYVLFYKKP